MKEGTPKNTNLNQLRDTEKEQMQRLNYYYFRTEEPGKCGETQFNLISSGVHGMLKKFNNAFISSSPAKYQYV